MDALQSEREKLEENWKKKQSWLETVHLEQIFYRDVNSMEKMSNSQEVHLLYSFKKKTLQNNDTIDGENYCHVSTDPAEEQHSGKYCGWDRRFDQTPWSFWEVAQLAGGQGLYSFCGLVLSPTVKTKCTTSLKSIGKTKPFSDMLR